ncbi:MAG: hypothetical protein HDT39_03330 [Lachnospiraceae bacterium]|nr:hypothetical protein [Lachnospiraceae bacterium]
MTKNSFAMICLENLVKIVAAKKNKCMITMSTWNKHITDGLHMFYILKIHIEIVIEHIVHIR